MQTEKQKNFLKALDHELQSHPYKKRFLEEVEAHAEDMENDQLADEVWEKRMGEAKTIKRDFIKIMEPFGKLFFCLEGLFYGLFLIPISVFAYLYLKKILSDGFYWDNAFISLIFLNIGPLLVLTTMLYWISFKQLRSVNSVIEHRRLIWPLLVALPGCLTFILITFGHPNFEYEKLSEHILRIDSYILLNFLAGYIAWKLQKKSEPNLQARDFLSMINIIGKIFLAYFFISVLTRNPLLHILNQPETPQGLAVILKLFSPLILIEQKIGSIYGRLMSEISPEASLITIFYLPMTAALLTGAYSLWKVVKSKKYFTIHALVIFYLISLIFIDAKPLIQKPDFKLPLIHISGLIEKKIIGIFYPAFKYFNANGGNFFMYQVGVNDDSLMVRNNVGVTYYLKPHELENAFKKNSYEELIHKKEWTSIYQKPKPIRTHYHSDDFYKQFINNLSVPPEYAVLDKHEEWALFVTPNEKHDTQEVYLVKLSD